MKKILTILGLASVLTLGVGGAAEYISTNTQMVQPVVASAEETWDVTENFDSVASIDDNFDFYFCSSQNAYTFRRGRRMRGFKIQRNKRSKYA